MIKYILIACATIFMFSCQPAGSQGLQETDSGYKFEKITSGKGETIKVGDFVYFNTRVSSFEGDEVYNSGNEGQPGLIKIQSKEELKQPNPFNEILLGAQVGDSIQIHLGKADAQGSGFDSLLYQVGVFKVLDSIQYKQELEIEQQKKALEMQESKKAEGVIAAKVEEYYKAIKSGMMDSEIVTTASGLKYIMHEKGEGELIAAGSNAKVNYYGVLSRTGEEFDNSWKRGQAFSFPLGQKRVIQGWDEGVALLPKGSKATLIIPGELAYGERGSGKIEANDELIFYIEVLK